MLTVSGLLNNSMPVKKETSPESNKTSASNFASAFKSKVGQVAYFVGSWQYMLWYQDMSVCWRQPVSVGLKLPAGDCHNLCFKPTLCGQNMRNVSHDFVSLGNCCCEKHFLLYTVTCALH